MMVSYSHVIHDGGAPPARGGTERQIIFIIFMTLKPVTTPLPVVLEEELPRYVHVSALAAKDGYGGWMKRLTF